MSNILEQYHQDPRLSGSELEQFTNAFSVLAEQASVVSEFSLQGTPVELGFLNNFYSLLVKSGINFGETESST